MSKVDWNGLVLSAQARIRLNRSFDERTHSYLGYALLLRGSVGGEDKQFWLGIGKAAQEKFQFQCGMTAQGKAHAVEDLQKETVEYYKVSGISVDPNFEHLNIKVPPWNEIPPDLAVYRSRGHRRLSKRTYETHCVSCIWACHMPVIITVDHWKPEIKQFRTETFCYGPKSCGLYKAGPNRKVPGRRGMTWVEEDWIDEELTAHRGLND